MTCATKFGVSCGTCFFYVAAPIPEIGACLLVPPPQVNETSDDEYDYVVSVKKKNFCQSWRLATDPRVDLLSRIEKCMDLASHSTEA